MARGLRDNSPDAVTVDIGSRAWPTISDQAAETWLNGKDPDWNSGC